MPSFSPTHDVGAPGAPCWNAANGSSTRTGTRAPVATSNTAPDDLFKGKPGRDAFLPFIGLIKRRLDLLVLDAARDYRRQRIMAMPTWHMR